MREGVGRPDPGREAGRFDADRPDAAGREGAATGGAGALPLPFVAAEGRA